MSEKKLTRRTTLKSLAAGLAASAGLGAASTPAAASAFGFTEVTGTDSQGDPAFQGFTEALGGTYGVGPGGDVYSTRGERWLQKLEFGPTTNSKTLYGAEVSDDGRNVWFCGGNGVVGQYDTLDRRFTDFSYANGIQNQWSDIAVAGPAGEERVTLVNSSGQVVSGSKTDAGGMDWGDTLTPNGGAPVYAVDYYDDTSARFADGNGDVFETADGGRTWTNIGVEGLGKTLYGICCQSDSRTVAVGGSGRFAEYDGESWSVTQVGGTAVFAVDRADGVGLASGGSGYLYEFADGSWEQRDTGSSAALKGSTLADVDKFPRLRDGAAGVDAAGGGSSTLYERGDFTARPDEVRIDHVGDNPVDYRFEADVNTVKGADADAGDTVNTDTYPRVEGSVDAGDTDNYWTVDAFDDFAVTGGTIADVDIYLNGREVSDTVADGAGWGDVPEDNLPTTNALYTVTDAANGPYAAGAEGVLARRKPDPSHEFYWYGVFYDGFSGRGKAINGLATSDDGLTVWGAGNSGELGRYDTETEDVFDHSKPADNASNWYDIAVTGATGAECVYLVNSSGELLQGDHDDGTMTWSELRKPGNGNPVRSITFIDDDCGFFCTDAGTVFRTLDGGNTWTDIGIDRAGVALYDVDAAAPDDIHVAGGSGYVFRYNGATWTKLKMGGSTRYGIARDGDRALASGKNEIDTRYLRGWETDDSLAYSGVIHDIACTDEINPTAVAVGAGGLIYEQCFVHDQYPSMR